MKASCYKNRMRKRSYVTLSRLCRNEPGKEKSYVAPNLIFPSFIPYFVLRARSARFGGARLARRARFARYRAHGPFGPMGRGPVGPMGRRRALRAVRASRTIGPMGFSSREICRNPCTV